MFIKLLIISAIILVSTATETEKIHPCPRNQTWANEGTHCDTCSTFRLNIAILCALIQEDGCYCNDGYIWTNNNYNQCILAEDCPIECGKHEVEVRCESSCQPTCAERKRNCVNKTCWKGCHCKPNFIRDVDFGECIPVGKCGNCKVGKQPENN